MAGVQAHMSVAKDFSPTPGARSPKEGPFSGEEFLERKLKPAFDAARGEGATLTVDLAGTEGYATSFLEAAFGGLARIYGPDTVLASLVLKCADEPYIVDEAIKYIKEAGKAA